MGSPLEPPVPALAASLPPVAPTPAPPPEPSVGSLLQAAR
jgi:hypothetical protein